MVGGVSKLAGWKLFADRPLVWLVFFRGVSIYRMVKKFVLPSLDRARLSSDYCVYVHLSPASSNFTEIAIIVTRSTLKNGKKHPS